MNCPRPAALLALLAALPALQAQSTNLIPFPGSAQATLFISPTGNYAWSGHLPLPNSSNIDGPFHPHSLP